MLEDGGYHAERQHKWEYQMHPPEIRALVLRMILEERLHGCFLFFLWGVRQILGGYLGHVSDDNLSGLAESVWDEDVRLALVRVTLQNLKREAPRRSS